MIGHGPQPSLGRQISNQALSRAINSVGSIPSRPMRSRICGHSRRMNCSRSLLLSLARGAGGDEHADAALDHHQPFVLEPLIGLGDGQRVGAFLGGQRAHRRQRVAVLEAPGDDRVGDHLAEADIDWLFMGVAKRHAVVIQRGAKGCNPRSGFIASQADTTVAELRPRPLFQRAGRRAEVEEAGDPLAVGRRTRRRRSGHRPASR